MSDETLKPNEPSLDPEVKPEEVNAPPQVGLAGNIPEEEPKEKISNTKETAMPAAEASSENVEVERPKLPEEVLAAQKLDRDRYRASKYPMSPTQTQPVVDKKSNSSTPLANQFNALIQKLKSGSNPVKILIIVPVILVAIFVLMFIAYLLNIDTTFFKITMQGKITDSQTQVPISYAKVYINNVQLGTSDLQGNYQISNLTPQVSEVKVQANGYNNYDQQIAITRGFMAYTITQNFTLNASEKAIITGRLVPNTDVYDFSNDKLYIDDQLQTISTDGTFTDQNGKTGTVHFQYLSPNFKDIDTTYVIKSGTNRLADVVLVPAGDITGDLKSYVSETLVLGAQFNIENVLASQVNIKNDGSFTIRDLDVDKKYKIQVIATGYKTRNYEIVIAQGNNALFNFRLVEDFNATFLRKTNNQTQLYSSDLDGNNSEQLTFITNFNPTAWFYNSDESKIYFLSSHEQIQSLVSPVKLAYSIDTSNNTITRLTTNTTNLGNIYSNFRAKKLFSISDDNSNFNDPKETLIAMDLDGNNRKNIKTIDKGNFSYVLVNDSGNYIFFNENDPTNAGFYRQNILSGTSDLISQVKDIKSYDTTVDGGKIIFARKNSATGFYDLALYTFATNETRILQTNLDGFDYQFVKGSDDQILYYASRAGKYNIYKFTISQNKDEKVTDLSSDYTILDIYQNKNFLFYYTNKGLYVLDITAPKNYKLVTSDTVLQTTN